MTHRTKPADDYASYLLRFWRDGPEEPDALWQAQIESIQTGQSWRFSDPEALMTFLEEAFPSTGRTADNENNSSESA